ncbi:MAG: glycosyltransferase family 2 protein, partial [Pseudorhodobacter sp.]|nr:glycosyltransferase family 2 protein [Frankiaceae bacterium]
MTVTTVAITLVALVAMLLSGLAVATLWWQLHAWRTPETLVATGFGGDPSTPSLSFSLLV